MGLVEVFAIAIALSMDAFAVCVSTAATLPRVGFGHYARFSAAFGGFQFLMPVIGWFLGASVHSYIEAFDHWIAFGLLAVVGLNMIREAIWGGDDDACREQGNCPDPTKGLTLFVLAVATSIDALAVGLSFSMIGVAVWLPAVIIGIVCALISATGVKLGTIIGNLKGIGERAGLLGGLVLIGIGVRILFEHGVF